MAQSISKQIFRAYDIRGLYNKDISPDVFYKIGLAAGSYVKQTMKDSHIVIGCDIRQSSPPLTHAFIAGVTATGVNIQHTGTTSFGQTLFAGGQINAGLIAFVTASHLPPEWNGIKFYYGDGVGFPEDKLMTIRDLVLRDSFELASWDKIGQVYSIEAKINYKNFFVSRFKFKNKFRIPVLGVPVESASLKGLDSLLSIVQMPGGIPVATLAIGKPGATNAALLAVAILAGQRPELREKLREFRREQAKKVLSETLP